MNFNILLSLDAFIAVSYTHLDVYKRQGTGDTKYANMRKSLGYEEPFHVKYWGLGNEMYGDWQFGSMSAQDYAKKALDFAKAMKWADPSIELVACGYDLGSDWNYEVARVLKPLIDHVAIHHYSKMCIRDRFQRMLF